MIAAYASPLERIWYYAFRIVCGLVLVFLMLPILVIAPLSFNADSFMLYPMSGFSLKWYEEFFTSPAWRQALMNSLIVSPLATLLAMVLGTLASIGLVRAEFPGKALLTAVLISPMVVPVVVIGVAMYIFFAPLGLTGSYTGLVLAHAILGVPFVVTTVTATLQGFDFNLVRAASSLGANPVTTFFRVTLPMVAPGIISGGLFAFATSFDELTIALFSSGGLNATLPKQFWDEVTLQLSPVIAAVSTCLFLFLALLIWIADRLHRSSMNR